MDERTYEVVDVLSDDGALLLVAKGSDGDGNFVARLYEEDKDGGWC